MASPKNQELAEQLFLQLNFEKKIYDDVQAVLRRIAKDAADVYENAPNDNGLMAVSYMLMFIQMRFEKVLIAHYAEVITAFSKRNFSKFPKLAKHGKKEKPKYEADFSALAEQWIVDHGLSEAESIAITTRKDILDAIVRGQQEGLSATAIAKNMRDKIGEEVSRYRAQTIAITETHNAASFANYESANLINDDLDLGLKKQWLTTDDGRTRPAHAAANNQIRDMEETFSVGGSAMKRPGDRAGGAKNVIRCRCVTRFITTDDEE